MSSLTDIFPLTTWCPLHVLQKFYKSFFKLAMKKKTSSQVINHIYRYAVKCLSEKFAPKELSSKYAQNDTNKNVA